MEFFYSLFLMLCIPGIIAVGGIMESGDTIIGILVLIIIVMIWKIILENFGDKKD